jgi:hypothetical protein
MLHLALLFAIFLTLARSSGLPEIRHIHQLLKHDTVSVVLYMNDQYDHEADHDRLKLLRSHQDDILGHHVFNRLQAVAQSSNGVIDKLRRIPYIRNVRSYHIVNCVFVDLDSKYLGHLQREMNGMGVRYIESNMKFKVDLALDFEVDSIAEYEKVEQLVQSMRYADQEYSKAIDYVDKALSKRSVQKQMSTEQRQKREWHLDYVKVDQIWTNYSVKGQGLIYANADTGVMYNHEALVNQYKGNKGNGMFEHEYSWWNGVRNIVDEPYDDEGHGTHTTSTAIGTKGLGIAPEAKWIACKNMEGGVGSPETYISCLQFFLAPHDRYGLNPKPHLRPISIGNSYNCPTSEGCATNTFNKAVDNLKAAGIYVALAAGNEGPSCRSINVPPACEKSGSVTGALAFKSNRIAYFSSKGPCVDGEKTWIKPDLVAPGSSIVGAYPGNGGETDFYKALSGTSMATPINGASALIITQACPCYKRNVDAIQKLLQDTATKIPVDAASGCANELKNSIPNTSYGYGLINLAEAVKTCRKICSK